MISNLAPSLSVAHNPWAACALLLTVRILGVGMAWAWLVPGPHRVASVAAAAVLGVTANAMVAMLLAEAGLYRGWVEVMVLAGIALAGWVLGRGRHHGKQLLPGAAVTALVFAVVMGLPHRGEWIGGGWDPGIYVCQGVAVSQGGDATPDADPLLSALSSDELRAFSREVHNYTEYLPVVPVDPATKRIQPFFFRLTPSWIAVLYRCGGLRAATRVNLFTAWPVLLLLGSLLWSWKPHVPHLFVALAVLLLNPVWLFMLNFPTSEMLQLMLVLGLMMFRPHSTPVTALLLFAALTNRFSFLPFAGLLLCAFAWTGSPRDCVSTRLVLVVACAAGIAYDYVFCAVTIGRLDELVLPLLLSGSGLLVGSLVVGDRIRAALSGSRVVFLLFAAVLVLLAADLATGSPHVALRRNLGDALPYLGPLVCLAAMAGWGLFGKLDRTHQGMVLFLAGATLATFTVAAIAPLYPWALRRHLIYTLPLLACLAAVLFAGAWDRYDRLPVRLGLVAAAVLVLGANAPRGVHALARTELNGLSSTLDQVAGHLQPGDVVVADHFRWGTPLRFLYGAQVLNGELLWADGSRSPGRTDLAQQALRRLRRDGRRIVFFTSTERGMAQVPGDWGRLDQVWSSGPKRMRDLNHHQDATGFSIRERTKVFALYVWPESDARGPDRRASDPPPPTRSIVSPAADETSQ